MQTEGSLGSSEGEEGDAPRPVRSRISDLDAGTPATPAGERLPKGPSQTPPKPRWGDEFEVRIDRIDQRGRPRGRATHGTGEYAVILRRGVVGSLVRVRVVRRRGERIEGEITAVLEPGPLSVPPRCRHFGTCGGCSWQDVDGAAQLEFKRGMVQAALDEHGLGVRAEPCERGGPAFAYRNKMEFSFGRRWIETDEPQGVEDAFALGLHPARQFRKVFDLLECPIQPEPMTAVVQTARRLARAAGLAPWNPRAHSGLLRHLVLRRSVATGELMVVLVTSGADLPAAHALCRELLAAHPEITTLIHAINTRAAQVAVGEREELLHGPGFITERVAGLDFRLSPRSFFQTNTAGAERLVELVRAAADCRPDDTVLDLYCGTGLFALTLARGAGRAFGCELVEPAVVDARANAERNGVANVSFEVGDVAKVLARGRDEVPDVVVIDPPRAGLHPSVPQVLGERVPRRLVYVACNHRAAARDLAVLTAAGLRLTRAQPLDLFPHTPHVECVFTLDRVGGTGP